MQFSLAPMEGITGYVTRNAFLHHFNYIDKYYTPFIPAAKRMSKKIIRDLKPENNVGINLIPQVMSNKVDEVLYLGEQLKEFGYTSMNINLGCPSGTVVSKKRGSGFLTMPDELDRFLDELYTRTDMEVSIKTRIGFNSEDEWEDILEIYSRHPIPELIIHPRIQKDFYKNAPRLDAFAMAVDKIDSKKTKLCYNGDITNKAFFDQLVDRFPSIDSYMIGRGLYAYPGLIAVLDSDRQRKSTQSDYLTRLRAFCDEILQGYLNDFGIPKDAMFHMKEIWSFLYNSFENSDKYWKKIRKCQTLDEYHVIVNSLFSECPLRKL